MRSIVSGCLGRFEVDVAEVHVLMTGDERIRELNRVYLDSDRPTDVLSFPDGDELPSGRRLLGSIVISIDAARRQASTEGHDETRELCELVLHGALHLLGYDHESDDGEMDRVELELREELLS
jgi:probable rRNA maturation factor